MKLVQVNRLVGGCDAGVDAELNRDLEAMAAELGRPEWHLELAWIEDDEMSKLNITFREHEGVTDVLSFTNLVQEGSGPAVLNAGDSGAAHDLWWEAEDALEAASAGEIALAPRYVERCCHENDWSYGDELALLVVHGMLHLLGWEHRTEQETAEMRVAEKAILGRMGRRHPISV